ncbi:MAG: YeiH family protein [Candidatus Bipolaricaulota bacterium]
MSKKLRYLAQLVPGIVFLFAVGLLAKYIGQFIPYVSYLIVAIFFGIIGSNLFHLPETLERGIVDTHKIWLKTGIVVLGARVLLADLVQVGPNLLGMIFLFIVLALFGVEFLGKRMGLDDRMSSCLASGTSVCGVSAVIATGGAIDARKSHLATAIATILIFDVVTVFLYPLIGELFSIAPAVFGPWAGVSMFSTGTTVAAGFAHSDLSGQLATVTKMGRNVFIGIWALAYSLYYVRSTASAGQMESKAGYLWDKFPKEVMGFILFMFVANVGLLNSGQIDCLKNAYNWLFMMAFVGLGYGIDLNELKKVGGKAFLVVCTVFIFISLASLGVSFLLFG